MFVWFQLFDETEIRILDSFKNRTVPTSHTVWVHLHRKSTSSSNASHATANVETNWIATSKWSDNCMSSGHFICTHGHDERKMSSWNKWTNIINMRMSHITASNIGMDKALGNSNYFARVHTFFFLFFNFTVDVKWFAQCYVGIQRR